MVVKLIDFYCGSYAIIIECDIRKGYTMLDI